MDMNYISFRNMKRSLGVAGETIFRLKVESVIDPSRAYFNYLNINKTQASAVTQYSKFDVSLNSKLDDRHLAYFDIKTRTEECWEFNSAGKYVFKYESVLIDKKKWEDVINQPEDVFIVWISSNGIGVYFFHKSDKAGERWVNKVKLTDRQDTRGKKAIDTVHFKLTEFPIKYGWTELNKSIRSVLN